MRLVIENHPFRYEMEKLAREFYPDGIEVTDFSSGGEKIVTGLNENGIFVSVGSAVKTEGVLPSDGKNEIELKMARLLFSALREKTGYSPEWGVLTGIRPSKVMRDKVCQMGEDAAKRYFRDEFFVSDEKTSLAFEVGKREQKIIDLSKNNSFSLYISIPFCPTRCSYCSFISHSFESVKKMIPEYTEKLADEIRLTGKIAKDLGLRLETVYFGGGTPTSLSAGELEKVISAVTESFDMNTCREFTVEAGRPDTVTEEKLRVLKQSGVTRISINPQTFNDGVLKTIGRRHTSAQTVESFLLARKLGFDNINTDLIAGLPGDTFESFENSLESALKLDPENITVHTLSVKRSSFLSDGADYSRALIAQKMLESSYGKLRKSYFPYYMYRQSKTLGNLENVGWCKENKEGLYNIFMMEETHTVLACGAGAVTKLRSPADTHIERIFNFKYPFEYIKDYAKLCSRKDRITQFYSSYNY